MCHESFGSDVWLKEQLARELLEAERERDAETADAAVDDGTPDFLNDEREADVELLTDGRGE